MSAVTVMDYNELLSYWQTFNGSMTQQEINDWISVANSYNVSEMQAIEDLTRMGDAPLVFNQAADGSYTITGFSNKVQVTQPSYYTELDSNVAQTSRSTITRAANRSVDANGKVKLSTTPASGSFGQNAIYYLASVGQAVTATSVGISLGKAIDSALYNANPDYWDSIGMSSLNPETWNSITSGDTSLGASLFNFVFGLNPDTGESQAYMDANALAYMAMVLNQNGWFNTGQQTADPTHPIDSSWVRPSNDYSSPIIVGGSSASYVEDNRYQGIRTTSSSANGSGVIRCLNLDQGTIVTAIPAYYVSESPFTASYIYFDGLQYNMDVSSKVLNNKTYYYTSTFKNAGKNNLNSWSASPGFTNATAKNLDEAIWVLFNTTISGGGTVDGVSDQTGSTIPNTSTWDTIPNTLTSLQQQYPSMFNNALVWDNVQPDGTNPQLVYVPVAWPDISSYNDTQPTGITATQTNTKISDATETLVKTLTDVLQQTLTQTQTGTLIPPSNPIDTGTGDSPSIAAPTGEATALWSVYHPTQSEINSFGAWLWGSPFTTNINKLFQNPIEGVISLHKVFATPVDSGTSTIVVGTLDSNVSSATVTQQYVYINCGSVKVNEDFVNVFDYPPYTQISLYLPFIGIVPLDVNDVMRSTVNVTYGVDVFTGACLAIVEITRDSHTVTMYQYAGVCAVSYPLGNVQHSQMVSGLLAIAGGVASMVASGGVSAPAALTVAAGAASASKSTVGRSGGFSGNAGAMGGKKPYLIIQRPQTRVAETFPALAGYPTNKSGKLSSFSGQVRVTYVHVENMSATESELEEIEKLLKSGVLV